MDAKIEGDLIYVVGETNPIELGGSEYFALKGAIGRNVPKLDAVKAKEVYLKMERAIAQELIASSYAVNYGGLGIALAKVALAGMLGMEIIIPQLVSSSARRADYYFFSESQGRFVVTIAPQNKEAFERVMGACATYLGKLIKDNFVVNFDERKVVDLPILKMEKSYKLTFKGY